MINDMDRINIDTFVFEDPIAPLACSLQFSPLQKHNFISTSTDFLPQIICTAWSSLLHLSSWANVALAQPRNSGTKNIYFYDFNDQLLLFFAVIQITILSCILSYYTLLVISCFSPKTASYASRTISHPSFVKSHFRCNITCMVVHLFLWCYAFDILSSAITVRSC